MSQTQRQWECSWLHSNRKDKRQSLFIVFVKYKTSKLYSKFFFNTFRQITTIKSTYPYCRHTIWYPNACQASAVTVFVNRFISTTCTLNGRKVIAWIL